MILALDLATRTGWCRGEPGGPVTVGTVRLPSTGQDVGRFLNEFAAWLEPQLVGVNLVVFESPILRSANTQLATVRKLYSLAGVTEMLCGQAQIQCAEEHLSTAKKMLSGHGRAEKSAMVDAARSRGVPVEDDNQADAFGIFLCAVFAVKRPALVAYDPMSAGILKHSVCTGRASGPPCGAASVVKCKNHDRPGSPWCSWCLPPGLRDKAREGKIKMIDSI